MEDGGRAKGGGADAIWEGDAAGFPVSGIRFMDRALDAGLRAVGPGDESGREGNEARRKRRPYGAMAMRCSRVRKKRAPSEIAGVERQVSPSLLVATTENLSEAGITKTLPSSLVK